MFIDFITCEHALPLPDTPELSGVVWHEIKFATLSFPVPQKDEFVITEGGTIYRYNIKREWVEDKESFFGGFYEEKSRSIEQLAFTGEISFAHLFEKNESDFLIHFHAVFFKGKLQEIKLEQCQRLDNSERLSRVTQARLMMEKLGKIKNSFWFPFYRLFKLLVRQTLFLVRYAVGLIAKTTWKIQNFLTPF